MTNYFEYIKPGWITHQIAHTDQERLALMNYLKSKHYHYVVNKENPAEGEYSCIAENRYGVAQYKVIATGFQVFE